MERVLIGYGSFAKEILADVGISMKCFVDDDYAEDGKTYRISDFDSKKYEALICVADPKLKKMFVDKLPKDTVFWNHISKNCVMLTELTNFGVGNIICAGVHLSTNISISNHVHLNILTTVGHDCVIGDFVTTAPAVNISGHVNIDDGVYIGTNASIHQKINICKDVTIGLNAGVIRDITEPGVYIGTPAIKIK